MRTDTLVYQALFLDLRHGLVDHARDRYQLTHGQQSADRLRGVLGAELARAEELVASSGETSVVQRGRQDLFDFLDISMFHKLVEQGKVPLAPSTGSVVLDKARTRTILTLIKELKDVRDPTAHPGQEPMSVRDAMRVIDSALRLCERLELAESLIASLEQVHAELVLRAAEPPIPNNLAPFDDTLPEPETIVTDFVGRDSELQVLRAWLRSPDRPRWLLVGEGGKGKTSLAYRFAVEVRDARPDGLAGAFWISAKRRRFVAGDIQALRSPDFVDLESAVNRLLVNYGFSELLSEDLPAKQDVLLELLDTLPVLIILDDLDSVQTEDEDVVEFFSLKVAMTASKVLMTSRRDFAGMGSTKTVVAGLDEEAALEFVRTRLAMYGLEEDVPDKSWARKAAIACEGSPLYIEELIRLSKFLGPVSALKSWADTQGDTVREYALRREQEMLTDLAQEVLAVCSLSPTPLTIPALSTVANRVEHSIVAAIDELRRMHLVLSGPEEGDPTFHVNQNLALLVKRGLNETDEKKFRNALQAFQGLGFDDAHNHKVRSFERQAKLLLRAKRPDEARRTIEQGLTECTEDPTLLALLGRSFAEMQPKRGVDAVKAWKRASDLRFGEPWMYQSWATLEQSQRQWASMAFAAEEGLRNCRADDVRLIFAAGLAHSQNAQYLHRSLQTQLARKAVGEADRHLDRAIRLGTANNEHPYYLSKAHRASVLNSSVFGATRKTERRIINWLKAMPDDVYAREEASRRAPKYPSLGELLTQLDEGRSATPQ